MISVLIEIDINQKIYTNLFGPNWKQKLGQLSKSKSPKHIDGIGLRIAREIFGNITGFKFNYTDQFKNPKNKQKHRIIVKNNMVDEMPNVDFKFKCLRDEFLFNPRENDWLIFMCLQTDFKKAYILGKCYLLEFMPEIRQNVEREFFYQTKYLIPVEFNMDQIQYRKCPEKSHNAHHGIVIHQL